jgi:hypothetical protein
MARIKLNPKITLRALEQLKNIEGLKPTTTIGELQRKATNEIRRRGGNRKPTAFREMGLLKNPERVQDALKEIMPIAEKLHEKKLRRQGMQDAQRALQTGNVQPKLLNDWVKSIANDANYEKFADILTYTDPLRIQPNTMKEAINIAVKQKKVPVELKQLYEIDDKSFIARKLIANARKELKELNALRAKNVKRVTNEGLGKDTIPFVYEAQLSRKNPRPKLPVKTSPRVLSGQDKTDAMKYDVDSKLFRQRLREKVKNDVSTSLFYGQNRNALNNAKTKKERNNILNNAIQEQKNNLREEIDYYGKPMEMNRLMSNLAQQHLMQNNKSNILHESLNVRDPVVRQIYGSKLYDSSSEKDKIVIITQVPTKEQKTKYQQEYLNAFTDTVGRLQDRGKTKPTPRTRKPQDKKINTDYTNDDYDNYIDYPY